MRLFQLVPRIANWESGVFDYAEALALELRRFNIETVFVANEHDKHIGQGGALQGFSVLPDSARQMSPRQLSEHARVGADEIPKHDPVLLHYVGYGYAKRGAPFWLARWVEELGREGVPIITFFHELYATGRPWESSFWLSGFQQRVAARIAQASAACVTNRTAFALWLNQRVRDKTLQTHVLPVLSTIGEPKVLPKERADTLVIWSGGVRKKRLYQEHWGRVVDLCRRLGITRICDVGPTSGTIPEITEGIDIDVKGVLSPKELSELLLKSRCGLLVDYPSSILGKSTVFAAYAAHGVVPILEAEYWGDADGLCRGQHFVMLGDVQSIDRERETQISVAVQRWYSDHNVTALGALIARLVNELTASSAIDS